MNITIKNTTLLVTLVVFLLSSCKTVDIRTDYALTNNAQSEHEKGKQLLKSAYQKMGYDQLEAVETYEANALFKWKMPWTMMPMNALPGNKGNKIEFKFTTNTFDGNVEFLEGRKKGKTYGIQSWQTYRIGKDGSLDQIKGTKYNWGLATYHYVIEAPMRLLGAEIVRYAGEKSFNGKDYDLVYATWGKDEPHKEHDQWLVYINKQTGFIDLTELTINDFFLPMPKGLKGATVQYEREKTNIGTFLPSLVTIQLGKPKKKKKYVYNFQLYDYQFDNFDKQELYPIAGLEEIGDAKKETE
ncbi:MAG: hypothetical protein AAGE93_20245 [Bacteroidota bacterium]